MKKEAEIREDVVAYLDSLGYGKENIKYGVLLDSRRRVDLVVRFGNQNLIAVEIKHDPIIFNKISDIGFSPIARQLQKYAQELGANYYIISNGIRHLWLKTNEIGRPTQIDEVPSTQVLNIKLSNKEFLFALMDHVKDYLKHFPITGDLSYDFSMVIYYKIIEDLNIEPPQENGPIGASIVFNRDSVDEVLRRWKDLNFIEDKIYVLDYIDDFLLQIRNEWQVPRWLANLMVRLYPIEYPKNNLLDIYSKHGVLISSAHLAGWKNVIGFYANQQNEYWIRSQQLIANEEYINCQFSTSLLQSHDFGIFDDSNDCILVAPPFGYNITANFGRDKIDSIELLINRALKQCKEHGWVIAIVSDGVLLSSKFKKFRQSILKKNSLKGIINLTPETFKPYSNVSTSILLIQKRKSDGQNTFFASLDDVPKSKDISHLTLLKKWNSFNNNEKLKPTKDGFVVKDIQIDNFHFSNYWFSNYQNTLEGLKKSYQTIPLKELIIEIRRGSPLKQDPKGELSYISPAVIRPMRIRMEEMSFTSEELMPKKYVEVKTDDIIVNSIGTQKGSAALVTQDLVGRAFNQHLIKLTPNQDLVRPNYLALALNSDYVQKQLEQGSSGSVIPSLSLKSFESLFIPIPPFYIQDKVCEEYLSKQNRIEQKEKELNEEKFFLNKMLIDLGKEGLKK